METFSTYLLSKSISPPILDPPEPPISSRFVSFFPSPSPSALVYRSTLGDYLRVVLPLIGFPNPRLASFHALSHYMSSFN
ncbi:hypothetical protein GEMRC1_013317 [Eukaryota sp. GEM-RC1]